MMFLQKNDTELLDELAIPLLGIYPKESRNSDIYIPVPTPCLRMKRP